MAAMPLKLGQDMKPASQLKSLYYMYLMVGMMVLCLMLFAPLALFGEYGALIAMSIFMGIPLIVCFVIAMVWIPVYCNSITYRLTDSEMVWKRGVWFRKTGIVPYNRITNVDIDQGPVSRSLGIASIKVQTAGYSAPNARTSEIRIDGMTNFSEIRDVMMAFVRGGKPVAVETYDKAGATVIGELVRIRKLLEKHGKNKRGHVA